MMKIGTRLINAKKKSSKLELCALCNNLRPPGQVPFPENQTML